jgi:hypothetical protein
MYIIYVKSEKYANGLMISIPSLYKAIKVSIMKDKVMNSSCNDKTSNIIVQ